MLHYNANLLSRLSKIDWILFFEVNVVSSNPWVGPSRRIKISFFLLSTCSDELIPTPKIIIFLPNPLATEKVPRLSNLIPYPEYS